MHARVRPLLLFTLIASLPAAIAADGPTPIPVADLFSNPKIGAPRLSPDGKQLSVVRSNGDEQLVLVSPLLGSKFVPVARADHDEMRLKSVWWPNSDNLLLGGTTRNLVGVGMRSRASRLFGIPAEGGRLRWLGRRWPFFAKIFLAQQDRIVHDLPEKPDHVLIEYGGSIKRMNVTTGALRGHHPRKKFVYKWYMSDDTAVRAGAGATPGDDYFAIARSEADGEFFEIIRRPYWPDHGPNLVGVSSDSGVPYVSDLKDGRFALFEWDLQENARGALIFAHPRVDVWGFMTGSDRHTLIAIPYVDDVLELHFLDPAFRKTYEALLRHVRKEHGAETEFVPVSSTRDGGTRIFAASGPTTPTLYYLYYAAGNRLGPLLKTRTNIPTEDLSPARSVKYEARDGRQIPAVLTLPRGAEEADLPLIVFPHGQIGKREWLRWNSVVQLFASRGYAVLQPNARGSTGFGVAHANAGDREWGDAIQDDITDGVKWLVSEGVVDPDRVGIYGRKMSAYAALMGAVKTPDLYRAVAGYGGVYDLEEMIDDNQWYSYWSDDWHEHLIGNDSKRMRRNSPLQRAKEIRVPVLLGHGEDDGTIHPDHSRDMNKALKRAGKTVEYMEFENETGDFLFERNRIAFYSRLVAFFDEHLTPRGTVEP